MEGRIVRKASEIPAAFEEARQSGKPFMIEVKLDGSFTVWAGSSLKGLHRLKKEVSG